MTLATSTGSPGKPWRDSQRIGDIAQCEAALRESHTERAGQIYMLAEILTAIHRQAEAIEEHCRITRVLSVHIATWLPAPKQGA